MYKFSSVARDSQPFVTIFLFEPSLENLYTQFCQKKISSIFYRFLKIRCLNQKNIQKNIQIAVTFDPKHLDSNVIAFWKGLGTKDLKK